MSVPIEIVVDAGEGLARARQAFDRMPAATDRATRRALKKLSTWIKRRALQAASRASGVAQKFFEKAFRFHVDIQDESLKVWIGTNPIPQHRFGTVVWTPFMRGARRIDSKPRTWRGSWSWGGQGKSGPAIMQRTGSGRLPIVRVTDELPHEPVLTAMARLQRDAMDRFDTLLRQELNYALNVEAGRG